MAHDHHLMTVEVASGDDLAVRQFNVREALNAPFEVELLLRGKSATIDLAANVGQACSFNLMNVAATGQSRLWFGVCADMELLRAETRGESTYRLRLVPRLWLLSQRVGNRTYLGKTLPEIAQQILDEWQVDYKLELNATYIKQDFVVQYGETDLQFVHRMLERAGITYTFDFEDGCSLILTDEPTKRAPRENELSYADNPLESTRAEFVTRVRVQESVAPGAYTLRDFDFRRKPDYPLFGEAPPPEVGEKYEQYRYEPGVMKALDPPDASGGGTPTADDKGQVRHSPKEGTGLATRRMEAERRDRRTALFITNCIDLGPGTILTISDHPRAELGEPMMVTAFELAGVTNEHWTYVGEAVFTKEPYRPLIRTPRPRIRGVQSAIVVGPKGEEIHTDEFGRVRVQFHWDREGQFDDKASPWVRVSQEWAGGTYGQILIPRVGQEVLVAFLEGDPDHPLVVGRVYNATQPVPYKLPRHKTRSGWRTSSTPGGDGFSEMLLEDEADKEVFFVQAQRDMTKLVKREEVERVGENKIVIVGNNRSSIVKTVDATMVGKVSTWEVVSKPSKDDLKILEQKEPSVSSTKTVTQMVDKKIIFTTGSATVAFDAGKINFEASGNITVNAAGGDVTLEGSRTFINTMGPPPAPKPIAIPESELGTFSSVVDRDAPPPPVQEAEIPEAPPPPKVEAPKPKEPPKEDEKPECRLIKATVECAHGPDEGGGGRFVPKDGHLETWFPDTLTCKADVAGACGKHPEWTFYPVETLNGSENVKIGPEVSYVLGGWAVDGDGTLISAALFLFRIHQLGKPYSVRVSTCKGGQSFRLKGWPDTEVKVPKLIPKQVEKATKMGKAALEKIFGTDEETISVGNSRWKFKLTFLKGKAELVVGFKEVPSTTEVFLRFVLEVGFSPLIGAEIRATLPLPPPIETINWILSKLRIASLAIFGQLNTDFALTGKIGRYSPGGISGAITGTLTTKLSGGLDMMAADEAVTARLTFSTTVKCPFGIEAMNRDEEKERHDTVDWFHGPFEYGDLKGELMIKINSWWLQKCVKAVKQLNAMQKYRKYFKKDDQITASVTILQSNYAYGKQVKQLLPKLEASETA